MSVPARLTMLGVGFTWAHINGDSIIIAATVVALGVGLYRVSPYGKQTVEALKDLLDATKAELEATKNQRDAYQEALDTAVSEAHRLELVIKDKEKEIAELAQRPNTTILAEAIRDMNTGFDKHRADLTQLLETLVVSNGKLEEGMASNTQALVLLVDRNRAKRESDT